MAKADLTAQRLRELIHYDTETGIFTWLRRALSEFRDLRSCEAWNGRYAGKQAGGISGEGHISIRVEGTAYWAHRLAVLYVTGKWPEFEVDHWNTEKTDNRYRNLRDVPGKVNRQNIRISPASKGSGLPLGVYRHTRLTATPYSASLRVDDKTIFLGYHATAESAHHAYLAAKRALHEGCTI